VLNKCGISGKDWEIFTGLDEMKVIVDLDNNNFVW
jgi:hypothetical protein